MTISDEGKYIKVTTPTKVFQIEKANITDCLYNGQYELIVINFIAGRFRGRPANYVPIFYSKVTVPAEATALDLYATINGYINN